jgi:nucleotide-binding universal stress UspA family protein
MVPGAAVELLSTRAGDCRLLVLGSYGEGAWSGMLAGSVALGLIGRVTCPVAVVRGQTPGVPPPRGGPIVVGVDGSPAGRAALAFGADLAASLGTGVVVVRVWSDVVAGPGGSPHRRHAALSTLATEAATALEADLGPVVHAHPGVVVERDVVEETPLRALLGRAGGARMLVVGHRAASEGSGMLLGSTSRALVEFAPCPVVVVRPGPEHATAPPAHAAPAIGEG